MKSSIVAAGLLGVTTLGITVFPYAQNLVIAAGPTPHIIPIQVAMPDQAGIQATDRPVIDVVFALDTTGSMGGMIEAAKEKIWSIASTMANAQTTPHIRVGFVAFRDRGDAYITHRIDLSDDLDSMYANLMQFQAAGGGDGPESVNQALHEAVTQMSWSSDENAYKVVFLVGDAPAHTNYSNDVKSEVTARLAREKGIVINTIQCGEHRRVTREWKQIAQLGSGQYFQVEQSGGAIAMTTPYDEKLATLSRELDDTRLFYGDTDSMKQMKQKAKATEELHRSASVASRARRATFNASASGESNLYGGMDLVQDVVTGVVELADVAEEKLPASLQAMPSAEREVAIKVTAKQRKDLQAEIKELSKKRDAYAKSELSRRGDTGDSLDRQIFETVREQAAAKGLRYEDDAVRY